MRILIPPAEELKRRFLALPEDMRSDRQEKAIISRSGKAVRNPDDLIDICCTSLCEEKFDPYLIQDRGMTYLRLILGKKREIIPEHEEIFDAWDQALCSSFPGMFERELAAV